MKWYRWNSKEVALLFYLPPVLAGGAVLGLGLTNFADIRVKLLGSLITLVFVLIMVFFMVVLGKSILDDKKNGSNDG